MIKQPPLIAHAIHHLVIGGLENGLVNLINRINPDEFRHAIICIDDYSSKFAERIERDDVEIIPLHKKAGNGIRLYPKITRLLRKLKPDILHSRSQSALDTLVPAMLAGVPVRIHGEHGWDESDPGGSNTKNQLLRKLHRPFVHRYITVSKDIEHYLQTKILVPADRIHQIYNGVDTEKFKPSLKTEAVDLPDHIRPDKHFIIGTVGRIQPVKAQADLLTAVALMLEQHPEWRNRLRLMIIGDGPLYENLKQQSRTADLTDVVWLPGARSDVPDLMNCMDIFALPSIAEGISNTILEAMASGLPVVATNVGGNKELVQNGITGVLVEPQNPHELAEAFATFFEDTSLCRQAGEASRRCAQEQFSLNHMVEQYLSVYRSALQQPQ